MTDTRYRYVATLLPSGKVLVAGGNSPNATAELYDPATAMFTAAGIMKSARQEPTATLLPNGKVLLAGGYSGENFNTGGATRPRHQRRAVVLLGDSDELLAGGAHLVHR